MPFGRQHAGRDGDDRRPCGQGAEGALRAHAARTPADALDTGAGADGQALRQPCHEAADAVAQDEVRPVQRGGGKVMQAHEREFRGADLRAFPMGDGRIPGAAARRRLGGRPVGRAVGGGGLDACPEALLGRSEVAVLPGGGGAAMGVEAPLAQRIMVGQHKPQRASQRRQRVVIRLVQPGGTVVERHAEACRTRCRPGRPPAPRLRAGCSCGHAWRVRVRRQFRRSRRR